MSKETMSSKYVQTVSMRTESMEFIDEGVRKSNDLENECRLNSLIQREGSKTKSIKERENRTQ